jgi:BlaI family penicillinase repressor
LCTKLFVHMTDTNIRPTDAELEILQILWNKGEATVREVNDILNASQQKATGYTTTLKLMQIMFEKGLLVRDDTQRTHIYSAAVREGNIQSALLSRFLQAAYKGSASKLAVHLLGNHATTPDELAEIRAIIEELENKRK